MKQAICLLLAFLFFSSIAFAQIGKFQLISDINGGVYKMDTETGQTWNLKTQVYEPADKTKIGSMIKTEWVEIPGETTIPGGLVIKK
jgi:hypothetical protein